MLVLCCDSLGVAVPMLIVFVVVIVALIVVAKNNF